MKVLGTPKFQDYLNKYKVKLHPSMQKLFKGKKEIPLESYVNKEN